MAINAKNIIVGGGIVKSSPPPNTVEKIVSFKDITAVRDRIATKKTTKPKPIEKVVEPTIIREAPEVTTDDHYHIVIENDLEKKYNKRSAYQSDMIDLK
jgi:hypothetical protein